MSPARFAVVATALLALALAPARGAETLRWAPKPGETLKYTLTQSFDLKLSAPGQEVTRKDELEVEMTWKVASVAPDGTIELAQTIDRARLKGTAPGVTYAYDTRDRKGADDPSNPYGRVYDALIGKPYTLRLSPRGEVVDVKMPEGAAEALADSPLAPVADAGSFYSAAGVKNILAQLLPRLPKDPVEKGASWDADLSVPSGPLTVDFKTVYTLAEVAPTARIDAKLETTITPPAGANITLKIDRQSGTARFSFDPKAGHLDSATINQSAAMTVTAGTLSRTQTTDAKLTFTLVK